MNRADEPPAGLDSGDQRAVLESTSRSAARRLVLREVGKQSALVLMTVFLLAAFTVVLFLAFLVASLVRGEVVTRSTQPDGELVVRVERRSFWSTCWSVHARPAGAWRWRYVGPQWCGADHAYLPFRVEQLHFAWYPEQGIVTTVEAETGKSIETARFLSAYRYSPDGRTIERIPLVEETDPADLTPEHYRVIEGFSAKALDANDAKIRKILALPTRVPPSPWPR